MRRQENSIYDEICDNLSIPEQFRNIKPEYLTGKYFGEYNVQVFKEPGEAVKIKHKEGKEIRIRKDGLHYEVKNSGEVKAVEKIDDVISDLEQIIN